jgi:hypothetical protein
MNIKRIIKTMLMADLGKQMLTVVFAFGGVGAAIIGVEILVGNATGSSHVASQGIMALLGVAAGLVLMLPGPNIAASIVAMIGLGLMLFGPNIAADVIEASRVAASPGGLGGGWDEAEKQILRLLIQLGAVIAAVGISWNAVLVILDALFSPSSEPSPMALNRILAAIVLLLGLLLAIPEVTARVIVLTRGVVR